MFLNAHFDNLLLTLTVDKKSKNLIHSTYSLVIRLLHNSSIELINSLK